MEKKTLEEANQSLLKKQKQNQGTSQGVLQLLRSKIKKGATRAARQIAVRHLFSDGTDAEIIIELFKKADKGTFICQQCKMESDLRFNPVFLAYDTTQKNCMDCDMKIAKAAREQVIADKINAFGRWRRDLDRLINTVIKTAGVPEIFRKASMKDLDSDMSKELSTTQSYFIRGGVGVGKSHMAVAIMREYLNSIKPKYDEQRKEYYIENITDWQPIFIEVPELLLRIRHTYTDSTDETEKDIVDYFTKTPFLVLDDLGTEKASEFSTLMLYLIINRRCTSGKTTIITSNLNLDDIQDRLSDRISSRIKGMCSIFSIDGDDKRCDNEQEQGAG